MVDAVSKEAPVDPVAASFLAICDILDHLAKTQPGVAGPVVQQALDLIRATWTLAADYTPPVKAAAPPPPPARHADNP